MTPPPQSEAAADRAPELRVIPLRGIGEVRVGDALAEHLLPALRAAGVRRGDVLCVSTKVVSKALGLRVAPADRDAAVAAAAVRTVARRRHGGTVTSVVQIPSGPVMAAAGVDGSNAPEGPLLLPEDPDACAAALREELLGGLGDVGRELGVVLSDTSSRVWRVGVSDLALGAAGIVALEDLRGGRDDAGRALTVTVRALADEIAAAADLVKGKTARVPAALVRGVPGVLADPGVPAGALSRTGPGDWFRRPSLESVWQALGLDLEEEPVAAMDPEEPAVRIARAVVVACRPRPDDGAPATVRSAGPGQLSVHPPADSPACWAAAGALRERLLTALGAEEIAAALPPLTVRLGPPLEAPRPGASGADGPGGCAPSPDRPQRTRPSPVPSPAPDPDPDPDPQETP